MTVQARAEALEAQVAATTARLQELRDSQRRLEARNALLETVASLNVSEETDLSTVKQTPALESDLYHSVIVFIHGQLESTQLSSCAQRLCTYSRNCYQACVHAALLMTKMSQHHSAVFVTSHNHSCRSALRAVLCAHTSASKP